MAKFVTKVVKSEEDGSLVMLFQPQLLEALNLKESEILQWETLDDGSIHITRTGFVYQSDKGVDQ